MADALASRRLDPRGMARQAGHARQDDQARRRQARCEVYPDRALHRHPARRDLRRRLSARDRPRLCRSRARRVPPAAHRVPRETKKRQPPVRLPDRLLAHLRRWHRLGIAKHAVVEWNGKPVRSVRKAFAAAVKAAGHRGPRSRRTSCATPRRRGQCRTAPTSGRPRASSA